MLTNDVIDHETRIIQGANLISHTPLVAASTLSFTNVFSSTYANYRVVYNYLPTAAGGTTLRFRDSGGQVSTALYAYALQTIDSALGTSANSFGRTQTSIPLPTGTIQLSAAIDIIGPNLATATTLLFNYTNAVANATTGAGAYNANTVFTGFDIIPASGNATGSVSIYGYRIV